MAERPDESGYDPIVRCTVVEPDRRSRQRLLSNVERATLANVEAILAADSVLDLSDVRVAIDGRDLSITGTVPGPATSARIETVASRIDGVDRIINELTIRRAT